MTKRLWQKAKPRVDWVREMTHHQPMRTSGPSQHSSLCPAPLPFSPHARYSSISAIPNKPVLDFSLSLVRASPLATHPAASPRNPNGIFSYQAAYQIQIPVMDKCGPGWCAGAPPSAINQRVARTIVSCRDVRHYEVHSEAQLSYKASNRSKSILFRQRRRRWTVYPYSCFRVNAELTLRKQPIFTGNVFSWSFSQDILWKCVCTALLLVQLHFE